MEVKILCCVRYRRPIFSRVGESNNISLPIFHDIGVIRDISPTILAIFSLRYFTIFAIFLLAFCVGEGDARLRPAGQNREEVLQAAVFRNALRRK